ncbi:unnamed protein product [Tuber melanosporum]|jgi:NADH dehydrogenase [ubiquinone] 1 alpha subcomplex assembly factor 2|uniref:(Perigord truffle) hypothetical protein n=1 Tax=Tuber melanosporum (strain Mel28) TaxID=656061 RepID=D5GAM5_TUBMM|nr:uncharacterized protein GSTUM_00003684001 [Tuber melanosporum]CAZ81568.1 unnamed protein product [Tuber melanosporum]
MTSKAQGNILTRIYYAWKSLKLPWRRKIFVGMDLEGNSFWEIPISVHGRVRRIVAYRDPKRDLVDYKLPPQWTQWLRHNRVAPTIAELHGDVARQAQLKQLAAAADARWNSKPSLLNAAPHPPTDSVLESNTKFCNDSGLQRREEMCRGRGETGVGFGGKDKEGYRPAGESVDRAHGARGGEAWGGKAGGEFKVGEWDPNAGLPKKRPGRE